MRRSRPQIGRDGGIEHRHRASASACSRTENTRFYVPRLGKHADVRLFDGALDAGLAHGVERSALLFRQRDRLRCRAWIPVRRAKRLAAATSRRAMSADTPMAPIVAPTATVATWADCTSTCRRRVDLGHGLRGLDLAPGRRSTRPVHLRPTAPAGPSSLTFTAARRAGSLHRTSRLRASGRHRQRSPNREGQPAEIAAVSSRHTPFRSRSVRNQSSIQLSGPVTPGRGGAIATRHQRLRNVMNDVTCSTWNPALRTFPALGSRIAPAVTTELVHRTPQERMLRHRDQHPTTHFRGAAFAQHGPPSSSGVRASKAPMTSNSRS